MSAEKWARWSNTTATTRWHKIADDEEPACGLAIVSTVTDAKVELRFDRPAAEDMCAMCLRVVLNRWAIDVLIP